ncbi:hypothetical protein UVI_02024720 [Ustilaginoidea virens]|uniref:Uncharacterized protein n=1 Tax=Ustilaginoidea virens TaxID=1159556 RepID=A0A1B5KQY3_USTVR|nr:hypothetical protein UVI_02024720 [Ustilaginoidea virens]
MHTPLQVTPPHSFRSNPTPPPTGKKPRAITDITDIIKVIKRRQSGHCRITDPWARYPLSEGQYADLLQRVQSDDEVLWDYMNKKLRYDYIPVVKQLVFRMPTHLHEWVMNSVVEELRHQLRKLGAGHGASADFARAVNARGSPTLDFTKTGYGKHDPDAQFRHSKAQYPGVVIEVSYAQKRKDLGYLAEDYILGSDGNIRVVIGLDVEYNNSKKATLSVWRPGVVQNEAGEPELVARQTITNQAEQDMAMVKQNQGAVMETNRWVGKRRRQRTPPEELDDDREAKFQKIEDKVMAQAEENDSSYEAD